MKRILYLITILIIFTNCSLDDDSIQRHFEVLPIESINLPQEFTLNETYTFEFTFIRPTNCYGYNNIINVAENENRTLAVNAIVFENNDCTPTTIDNISTQEFEFKVIYDQVYKFHIWKGKDAQGNDIYDDIEIPVN